MKNGGGGVTLVDSQGVFAVGVTPSAGESGVLVVWLPGCGLGCLSCWQLGMGKNSAEAAEV